MALHDPLGERATSIVGRHADARVAHGDACRRAGASDADFDASARRRERERVIEEVDEETIRKDLGEHGYVEATGGQPDFYIAYYVGLQDRYDVGAMGYGVPVFHRRGWWGWPGGYDVWSVPDTQSTLIVDIVDAHTNRLVWRGYDSDRLNSGNPEKTLDAAVDHIVSRLARDTGKHARA